MGIFVIGVTVLAAVTTAWRAVGADGDEPLWDLRWRALGPDDRARLAVAGLSRTSTAALGDPEERELAEGFGRRERRRRAYLDLALLTLLALAAALTLAGVADTSVFTLILAVYALLRPSLDYFRDQRIKSRAGAQAGPDAVPAR